MWPSLMLQISVNIPALVSVVLEACTSPEVYLKASAFLCAGEFKWLSDTNDIQVPWQKSFRTPASQPSLKRPSCPSVPDCLSACRCENPLY